MKNFYLLALAIISFNSAFSAPTITAISHGNWDNNTTWNLNRKPQNGDTVIILSGKRVIISNNQNHSASFMYIRIYGTLKLDGGKLTLNANSVMVVHTNGTLSGDGGASEKVRIGSNEVFRGNENPVIGPGIADGSTNNFMAFNDLPLPVKFIGYTVSVKNKNVFVQWSTSEEVNASIYEVQRSFDGTGWNTIAYISAAGNTGSVTNYSYTDKNITKTAYYRIKQVDMDGQCTYTPVRSARFGLSNDAVVTIASMPQGKILLQFPQEVKGNVVIRFTSLNGQLAGQQTINQPFGQIILNADANLKGSYVVSVNGQELHTAKQVIL